MVSLSDKASDALAHIPSKPLADYEIAARDFGALCADLALTVRCKFVPFSASRNVGEARPSLNWRCTVTRDGKPIRGLESVDYMQGNGHCPASKAGLKRYPIKADLQRAIALECETGHRAAPSHIGSTPYRTSAKVAPPTAVDVISSLCRDSDVIDYSSFEDWAADFGFDPDSRKGEAIYRACLAHALALRAAIGEDNLAKLRDLAGQM